MTDRKRLLVLASTFPARSDDGTPAFVRDLALREAEDFDTLVIVPRVPGSPRTERDGRLSVHRYPFFPRRFEDLADGAIIENLRQKRSRWLQVLPFFAAQFVTTMRAVRTFKPDVVHVHWIIPQGIVALAIPRRIPLLVTTLGGDLYALNAAPIRALKARVVRRAARVTVMNADMAQKVVELGAAPGDVEVMPMGAQLDAVRPRTERAPGEPVRLLFVGRLVEKKGLSHLLEAMRSLPTGSVRLRVVGDGPLASSLRREAEGLDVDFIGQLGREGLFSEYASADVAVFPSVQASSGDRDGLPVALLEAMGSGCAVVASRIAGIDEAVVDGVSGVLVTSGSSSELGGALERLISDEETLATLRAGAAERAQDFSVAAIGDRYRAILARLTD
jgi:glycosyltransferase involved in cell wall biosynthesis